MSPECVVAVAIAQMLEARHTKMEYNKRMNHPKGSESVIRTESDEVSHSQGCPVPLYRREAVKESWTMKQGYFVNMGGIRLTILGEGALSVESAGVISLAGLDMLPNLPSPLIDARNKADGLAKTLICLQVSWMFLQTIARKPGGLPITLLELHTLTHIVAAILMYAAWWYKPQDIGEAVLVDLGDCRPCIQALESSSIQAKVGNEIDMLGFTAASHSIYGSVLPAATFFLLGVITGAIHATAWNAHFPSHIEHQLWQVASCGMCGVSLMICISLWLGAVPYLRSKSETLYIWVVWIGFVLFYIERLYLVVEAFISVRSLPIGAYDTIAWVTVLPHIG